MQSLEAQCGLINLGESSTYFFQPKNSCYHLRVINERRIWLAVLVRAVFDLAGLDPRLEKSRIPLLQRSARGWLHSSRTDLGSFFWICNSLDLDPGFVRQAISKRADQLAAAKRFKPSLVDDVDVLLSLSADSPPQPVRESAVG